MANYHIIIIRGDIFGLYEFICSRFLDRGWLGSARSKWRLDGNRLWNI